MVFVTHISACVSTLNIVCVSRFAFQQIPDVCSSPRSVILVLVETLRYDFVYGNFGGGNTWDFAYASALSSTSFSHCTWYWWFMLPY